MNHVIDTLTERQLELLRYDAHLREVVDKMLRQLGVDLETLVNGVSFSRLSDYDQRRVKKLLADIKSAAGETYSGISDLVDADLAELVPLQASWGVDVLAPVLGVKFAGLPGPDMLEALARGKLIQGTVAEDWWNRQSGNLQFQAAGRIRRGVIEGWTNQQITGEIADLMQIARRDASSLVRTAVQTAANEAMGGLYRHNSDIVAAEMHVSTLDSRTTDICMARSGKRWTLDGEPINHKLPYKRPPCHFACRSALVPLLDKDEKLDGTQSSDTGYVSANDTFEEFLRRKGPEYADKMLGKGRAQLWRDGKITLSDLLDQRGNPQTLADLRAKLDITPTPDLRDAVTKEHFNGRVTVGFSEEIPREWRDALSPGVASRLMGAMDGAAITVKMTEEALILEARHAMLDGEMLREIREDESGLQLMLNESFMLKEKHQSAGIGARSFAIEAHEASAQGFAKIITDAAGSFSSNTFNGYYTWPRLGYNSALTQREIALLPQDLSSARTVLDLLETEDGRTWWLRNGSGRKMEFDLSPDSRSWRILLTYMEEKGIKL